MRTCCACGPCCGPVRARSRRSRGERLEVGGQVDVARGGVDAVREVLPLVGRLLELGEAVGAADALDAAEDLLAPLEHALLYGRNFPLLAV